MELVVAWSHLLNLVFANGVPGCDLRNGLGHVAVHVLDDRLLAGLTVHDHHA